MQLGVSLTLRQLCSRGDNQRYPLCGTLGGTQSRSRFLSEEKYILTLPGYESCFVFSTSHISLWDGDMQSN